MNGCFPILLNHLPFIRWPKCVIRPILQAFSAKNIIKDFEITRIHPLNENIFGNEEFLPSNVTDRPHETTQDESLEQPRPSTSTGDNYIPEATKTKYRPIGLSVSPYVIRPFPKALAQEKSRTEKRKIYHYDRHTRKINH